MSDFQRGAIALVTIASLALAAPGCGNDARRIPERSNVPIPIRIAADTGRATPLAIRPAEPARAWIGRVSTEPPPRPAAVTPTPPGDLSPALPPVVAESLILESESTPTLVVGDDLKPPIPRGRGVLRVPARERGQVVDLDVRVDESGAVSDALWAGGSADSAAVQAAVECALAMRFYPALQSGRPVAVWCRQRFAFGHRSAEPLDDE